MPTPKARDAARILGAQIAAARRRRRWTAARLAEQINVSLPTLRKIERGDPTVAIGTVLDAAVIVGVPLFGRDVDRLADHIEDRVALLPKRVTPIGDEGLDDDF
ncbi:MAG: helix-turn-helix domain-containing protein [Nitriliruptoraceae bacterium]